MTESQSNIRTLYATAKALSKQLENLETTSQVYQDSLRAAISSFEECRRLADQVSLFSPNETEDDIPSGDLQYLSIDYHLGELIPKITGSTRKATLQQAQQAYERYLGLLNTYRLLSKSDRRLYERYQDDRDTFSILGSSDPSARRETKIARYKQEQELKRKLEHLSHNQSALENDDSALRTLYLTEIQFNTHHTFHALDLIAQELKILALAPPPLPPGPDSLARDYRQRNGLAKDPYSDRLDPPISQLLGSSKAGPILSKEGKPLKPFVLLDNRQKVRSGVFRPDHSLPTMTIDEYLAEERRRGGMIDGGGEQSGVQEVVDEDDMEKADLATMKAREWDEFTEANPKGSGNTLNRG